MPVNYSAIRETPEEFEIRRRKATMKRVRFLSAICVLSIGARLLIKDPPPPKAPDRSKKEIRYVPGMIEDIPLDTLNKMDPMVVAKMRAAEAKYKEEQYLNSYSPFRGEYKPAEIPLNDNADLEALKQAEYLYAKRQIHKLEEEKLRRSQDLTKPMLIHFRSGGFLKAEATTPLPKSLLIRYDRNLFATLPQRMVASVTPDAVKWKEPIPVGYVQLKPAKGITITVGRASAKRITIQKSTSDET